MRRSYLPAAMAGVTAAFGALLVLVVERHGVVGSDVALNADLAPLRATAVVSTFLWVTALAAGPALTAVLVTSAAALWAFGGRALILGLAVSFFGAQATTWGVKYAVARPRPEFIQAIREASPSFPSGHATACVALYGFLAYAVSRSAPGRGAASAVAVSFLAVVGLIDFSRLVLSLHFLTDVVAGNLVGAFWLMAGCWVFDRTTGDRAPGVA